MKKNILIVTRWFYPANTPRAFRATELAKEFSYRGHNVTVLTVKDAKAHDDFSNQFGIEIIDLGKLTWRLPVFGQKGMGSLITRAIQRFFLLLLEFPSIELMYKVNEKLRSIGQYDMLISVAVPYPIHWGVAKARSNNNLIAKTWVADCGDPYMGDKTDSFRKFFYFKYVEKWFMHKADYITIPVEEGKKGYYSEFHNKIRVIPQGFKFTKIQETNYTPNKIPTFAYAGAFIPGVRDPRKFMEFLMTYKGDFRFIVYTQSQHLLQSYLIPLKDKLILKDYIPRENLLTELGKMDFLVNFDNNTGVQQPSKLIDYALTGRPIINIKGELDEKIIQEFLSSNYENCYLIPNINKYKIENIVDMFLDLVN